MCGSQVVMGVRCVCVNKKVVMLDVGRVEGRREMVGDIQAWVRVDGWVLGASEVSGKWVGWERRWDARKVMLLLLLPD